MVALELILAVVAVGLAITLFVWLWKRMGWIQAESDEEQGDRSLR